MSRKSFFCFISFICKTNKKEKEKKRALPEFNNILTISASPTFVAKYNGGTPSSDGNCISLGRTCKFTSAPSFISSVASFKSLYLKISWIGTCVTKSCQVRRYVILKLLKHNINMNKIFIILINFLNNHLWHHLTNVPFCKKKKKKYLSDKVYMYIW